MARRRFRNNQRHQPTTERSFQEYVLSTPAPQTSRAELVRMVRGGEDTFLELKVKLSNPEKIAQGICALANTGGGLIVFGVNDQLRVDGLDDPEEVQTELARICREDIYPQIVPYIDAIAFDNGRRIVALDVQGRRRPYRMRADGRFFIRVGAEKREATRNELAELLDEARPFDYERTPSMGATVDDIDEAHLWSFVRSFDGDAFDSARAGDYPTNEILERDLLLASMVGSEIVPTVAGMLLFGRDEAMAELLPRASIVVTRFAGDALNAPIVERAIVSGNLHTLYEQSLRFIERYCDLLSAPPRRTTIVNEPNDVPILPRANYNRDAVSEALANALVHRDLVGRDAMTRVHIFERALEIINPRRGLDFAPVALRAIRYGVPQRLNPQLSAIFSSPAYGLNLPQGGLPAMLRAARLFSGRKVEIHSLNDEFRVRFAGI